MSKQTPKDWTLTQVLNARHQMEKDLRDAGYDHKGAAAKVDEIINRARAQGRLR